MKKKPSQVVRVSLIVLVLVSALYFLPNRFIKSSKDQAEIDIKNIVAGWGDCDFNKPTVASMRAVLDSTNTVVSGTEPLTDLQKASLATNLVDMFAAYSSGDYQVYHNWRFCEPVEPRQNFISEITETIVHGYKIPPNGVYVRNVEVIKKAKSLLVPVAPSDPEKIFERFLRLQSLGDYYKGFWKGYCNRNMQVRIDDYGEVPKMVNEYKFSFMEQDAARPHSVKAGIENLGLATHIGFFTFKESPESILKEQGKVRFAHILLMIDMADERGAGPVVYQAYWAPHAKRWLPREIAEGNLWKFRAIHLCF